MFEYNSQSVTGYRSARKGATLTASQVNLTAASGLTIGHGQGTGGISSSAGGNFNSGGTFLGGVDLSYPLLQDLIDVNSPQMMDATYREIYLMDPVSGPVIDMLSLLPWSDYTLVGVSDPKIKALYESSLEEISIQRLMKMFMVSTMVLGKALGSLVFDKSRGIFTDCIIYNVSEAEISPIPLIGYDPKINIRLSKEFRKWLNSSDPRDVEARKEIDLQDLQAMQASGIIPLEPLKTIYTARTNLPGSEGVSVYSRVLPIWLLEKVLLRGTILASTRRQKSITHITTGSDELDYDETQLQSLAEMFANANRDPLGAIVVTRPDVTVSEVSNPTDLWSVFQENDNFTQAKLRALMVSDSFLSGDATYTNQENTIGIMLEGLRSQRHELTNAVIRDKLFLSLAKYHNFRQRTQAELEHNIRYSVKSNKAKRDEFLYRYATLTGSRNMAEVSTFVIPELKWTKDLKPPASSSELSLYKELNELMPLPLSMLAAAAGVDVNTVIDSYKDDVEVRKKIADFTKEVKALNPKPEGEDDEGGFSFESSDKVSALVEPITLKDSNKVNLLASAIAGKSIKLKPSQVKAVTSYVKALTKSNQGGR